MRKKFLVMAMALATATMLVACGNGNDTNDNSNSENPTVTEAPAETTPEATPTEAPTNEKDVAQEIQNIHQAVQEAYGALYGPDTAADEYYLTDVLKLDASWYDAVVAEYPMMTNSVETFVLVHPTEGNLENVVTALLAYQDMRINDNWYPSNLARITGSVVEVVGDYVCFTALGGMVADEMMYEDEVALIEAYKESNQVAIDTIKAVIAGELVVEPWTEMDKMVNAVRKAYFGAYLPNMQVQDDATYMSETLKLDASWYEEAIVEVPMISANADMFVLVKATEGNLDNVKNALEAYKTYLVEESFQYPMNEARVKTAVVATVGDYVCFSILGGALDNPEDYGITTDEDLMSYYENQNMTAVYALQSYLGIWDDSIEEY